jgi:hypothetical protein
MRNLLYPAILASTMLCQPLTLVGAFTTTASAQSGPVRPAAAPAAVDASQADVEQLALTEKQIEAFIAGQKTISAIVDKIPEDQLDNPNPQLQTKLDQVARKFGFKDYGEYEDVADNIDLVMDGFDDDSKTYVGQEVVLKKQLSEVAADKTISARERSEQIKELNEMLKAVEPVKFPNNIVVVTKYYDRLAALLDDDKQ